MQNLPLDTASDFDPFAGGEIERVIATTESQREVWLADQHGREASLAFNESIRLRLLGKLDPDALHVALQALLARHAALRASVGPDGTEWLISTRASLALPFTDLGNLPAAQRQAALADAAAQAVETPFVLARGPLLRATLFRLGLSEHVLMLTAHHIVCDGWSWAVIIEDLGALYAEALGVAPSPEPADELAAYVSWEHEALTGPEAAAHERFWLERYAGSSQPVLDLPTDRPRPPVRDFASQRVDHLLEADLVNNLRKLGARLGATMFGTLYSAFAAMLYRITGQSDLVIGVPAAGQAGSGMHRLVAHCVNLLPVRTSVDGTQPFASLVASTRTALLDAFDHQAITYGALLSRLRVERDASRLPLVSVMFNVDAAVRERWECFPGLAAELDTNPRHYENFELFVNVTAMADGSMRVECQYATQLFDQASIERWLRGYEALLASAVLDPARTPAAMSWLAARDLWALKALQPNFTEAQTQALMHTAFERQCELTPASPAVGFGQELLSYAELATRANRLAHELRHRGVRRGDRVGLCLHRGIDMLAAVLATLKAGGTYVPLDPGFPVARLAFYAEDAQLSLLVTTSDVSVAPSDWRADAAGRLLLLDRDTGWLQQSPDAPALADPPQPEDAAYLIYTSGSTGKPKGVMVPHRAAANFLASMALEPGLHAGDRLAAVTTLSFDIAVLELLLPLSVGAQVVIVPRETAMDGEALRALLRASGTTAMQATPGMWRMLVDAGWPGATGFKALVGGEAFPPDLAKDLLQRCGEVWNLYGPTETTVWSSAWRVDAAELQAHGMSIGRPIANTVVWIVDEAGQLCPIGVPGEICIGGKGVAVGYLNRPDLTADRFVKDPFSGLEGACMYRTGDRGRWRNEGLLEHLGRLDFQVKVRGYRIELGEIEAACNAFPGVSESVVLAREDQPGDVRLVAYLAAHDPIRPIDDAALREALRERLPDYMLPQHVVTLPALPRLPNGKVDRKALPMPQQVAVPDRAARTAARNDVEQCIVQAMEEVLKLPGLGVHDDFFILGGHSLLAARLTSRLNREFGLSMPLRTLFDAPTPEKLAVAVARARQADLPRRAPLIVRPDRRTAPLTPMQERIRFIEELRPGSVHYHAPSAHRLTGLLDVDSFRRAFASMIDRQPALRTSVGLKADGSGWEQHIAQTLEYELPFIDLRAVAPREQEAELHRQMRALVDQPMDLCRGPLFRAALFRLDVAQHVFLFMPHHLIFDGWSFDVLYEEMSAAYAAFTQGQANPLPPLPATFGDYAEWYADWLQGPEHDTQLAYWRQRFARAPVGKAPCPDRPRVAGVASRGSTEMIELDGLRTEQLRAVARQADATLNMLMLTVYAIVVAGAVDTSDLVVAMPVRGRSMAEVESVMGFFNNLLPMPISVRRETRLIELVRQVKADLLEAFSHQEVPFEHVSSMPEVAARGQRTGLYQALFSFQDARRRQSHWGPIEHQPIPLFNSGATEDLGLWLRDVPSGLDGGFTYNADIYEQATALAFRSVFMQLLERIRTHPEATVGELLELPDSPEVRQLRRLATPHVGAAPTAPTPPRSTGDAEPAPLDATGQMVAEAWSQALGVPLVELPLNVGFFDLGGTSLMAMRSTELLHARLGRRVPATVFVGNPSVRELARALQTSDPEQPTSVVLRAGGMRSPLFLLHDGEGEVLLYRNLAFSLPEGRAVLGIPPAASRDSALLHATRTEMVLHYLKVIQTLQPHGPYFIGGLCAGGSLAYEVAVRLQQQGEPIGLVALLDANHPTAARKQGLVTQRRLERLRQSLAHGEARSLGESLAHGLSQLARKTFNASRYEISSRLSALATARKAERLRKHLSSPRDKPSEPIERLTFAELYASVKNDLNPASTLHAPALLVRATTGSGDEADEPFIEQFADQSFGWRERIHGEFVVLDSPGGHVSMLQPPHVQALATQIQELIARSEGRPEGGD